MWRPRIDWNSDVPIFRLLLQAIADDVASGELVPGDRLPASRDLADLLGVARGTVAKAFVEAERLGLVQCDVGRGTFVLPRDQGARPYASLIVGPTALSDLTTNLPLAGLDPDPASALGALAERPDRNLLFRYHAPAGANRHRQAGALWLERFGISTTSDQVLVCAGAQHAIFVALAHLRRRSKILYAEELSYPGLHSIRETLRMELIPVAMDADGIDPTALARAIRRHGSGAIYLMPTIHNPTGAVLPAERRQAIARLARQHDCTIIEDDANRLLATSPPDTFWHLAPERTFLVASVSKILSPGLRIGYLLAPAPDQAGLLRYLWATHWMAGPLNAEIVAMWIEDGTVDRTIAAKRAEAKRRQSLTRSALRGLRVEAHPTSLHAWIHLPSQQDGARALAAMTDRGIVGTPASAFWTRATPPPNALRIALASVPRRVDLKRALVRLVEATRRSG
jgi:DNA-binding transcriptional MocR family regulator